MLNHLVGLKIKKNYDEEYFTYVIIIAAHHKEIKNPT